MVADTKNKRPRGRPKKVINALAEAALSEYETRTAQNITYAAKALRTLEDPQRDAKGQYDSFFMTAKGNLRRQGILEQIGRMLEEGSLSAEKAPELLEAVKEDCLKGMSVKEAEKILRKMRMVWKYAEPDPEEEI